ncbi:hypothetical protein J6590_018692 [Homalodisca vitripennis]|nr:hypothetical protein J6590_018692 [Homalodisca vitripennis]
MVPEFIIDNNTTVSVLPAATKKLFQKQFGAVLPHLPREHVTCCSNCCRQQTVKLEESHTIQDASCVALC